MHEHATNAPGPLPVEQDTAPHVPPGAVCVAEGVWYSGIHLADVPASQTAPVSYCAVCLGLGVRPPQLTGPNDPRMDSLMSYGHASRLANLTKGR